MDNLTFYDFDKASRGNRITGRKIRLHNKSGNRSITFSSDCALEIGAIATPKMRIAENNLTGEIYIVINSEIGIDIRQNNSPSSKNPSLIVYSKQVTDLLVSKLGLTEVKTDIELSGNLANRTDLLTYKILAI